MPVTDASIIAHVASAVIFVVGSEVASLPAAVRALEQLDATHARFLGAVLNGVNLQRNSFFYSPYYRREYSQYYGGDQVARLPAGHS
jgi:Mrp family chromosome partitioning ATPase